jgi:hypothetical protein
MSQDSRAVIEQHWATANAGDWEAFARLLDPELVYEVPQTRERVRSAAGYLDMFRTWPGPWHADVKQLICEPFAAVSVIDFVVGGQTMTGISFFRLSAQGRIVQVIDHWPEPYEPPARVCKYFERY